MERQLRLTLKDRLERESDFLSYVAPLQFKPREIAVLKLLYLDGDAKTVNAQHVSEIQLSRDDAAILADTSKNTFRKGVDDLVAKGLLAVITIATPWTYVANWSRLAKWEVPKELEPLEGHEIAAECWSPPVTPGHPGSDSVNVIYNIRDRVPVFHGSMSGVTDPDRANPDRARSDSGLPWRAITDDRLVAAVLQRDHLTLRALYREAVKLGWIGDSGDNKLKFLTICHHAATSAGLNSRVGNLIARVKNELDVQRTRQASDQWAGEVLQQARRNPALAGSEPANS